MATKQEPGEAKGVVTTIPSGGQYFVDQSTGQYYYQSQDGETMTVVQTTEVEQPSQSGKNECLLSKCWLLIAF